MAGKIIMGVLGLLLLLPGLCSISFIVMMGPGDIPGGGTGLLLGLFWLTTIAIAWPGYILIRKAWNR